MVSTQLTTMTRQYFLSTQIISSIHPFIHPFIHPSIHQSILPSFLPSFLHGVVVCAGSLWWKIIILFLGMILDSFLPMMSQGNNSTNFQFDYLPLTALAVSKFSLLCTGRLYLLKEFALCVLCLSNVTKSPLQRDVFKNI